MRFQFFAVPALFPEAAQTELNQFLARHRVAQMDSRLVEAGAESYWTVSVRYFENSTRASGPKANRIDYQEVLNPADFAVYNQLRAWRKKLAEQEGVPVYNILNNEQMAEVATRRPVTLGQLGEIPGVGGARQEKYGSLILAQMLALPPPEAP